MECSLSSSGATASHPDSHPPQSRSPPGPWGKSPASPHRGLPGSRARGRWAQASGSVLVSVARVAPKQRGLGWCLRTPHPHPARGGSLSSPAPEAASGPCVRRGPKRSPGAFPGEAPSIPGHWPACLLPLHLPVRVLTWFALSGHRLVSDMPPARLRMPCGDGDNALLSYPDRCAYSRAKISCRWCVPVREAEDARVVVAVVLVFPAEIRLAVTRSW